MDRRDFVKAGLTLAVAGSSELAASESSELRRAPNARLKLILRADDVGYTPITNPGTFKAVDANTVTSVDVMFDCPGTEDALEHIRKRPWLSIGWHNHCWGKPICGPSRVPCLVRSDGHFKWSVAARHPSGRRRPQAARRHGTFRE